MVRKNQALLILIFKLFACAIIVVGNSSKVYTFPFKVFLQILKHCLLYSQNDK